MFYDTAPLTGKAPYLSGLDAEFTCGVVMMNGTTPMKMLNAYKVVPITTAGRC